MPQQINGASIDITEYDGRPQDQQLEESDESYLWFLKYLANVNWSRSYSRREYCLLMGFKA